MLSIDQPYATLIMAGVKRFETRPSPPNGDMRPDGVRGLPGCTVNRGDRILIASTQRPVSFADVTDLAPESGERCHVCGEWYSEVYALPDAVWAAITPAPVCRWHGELLCVPCADHRVARLRRGCIFGSVTVADAVQIEEYDTCEFDALDRHVCIGSREPLELVDHERGDEDISDQLPLGDWQRGRWAWELVDPRPFDAPVPVVGRQGVWRWNGEVRP